MHVGVPTTASVARSVAVRHVRRPTPRPTTRRGRHLTLLPCWIDLSEGQGAGSAGARPAGGAGAPSSATPARAFPARDAQAQRALRPPITAGRTLGVGAIQLVIVPRSDLVAPIPVPGMFATCFVESYGLGQRHPQLARMLCEFR
jgi:hypothetical protein